MKTPQSEPQPGKIIPLSPKTSPLEDNPNHWQPHTSQTNLRRFSLPIEVLYDDGSKRLVRNPRLMPGMELRRVKFFRLHQEIEKMPFYLKFEWHRTFTLWDRIRILFGRNLLVPIAVACRHNPGNSQPVAIGYLTKARTLDAVMDEQRDLALKRFLLDKAEQAK